MRTPVANCRHLQVHRVLVLAAASAVASVATAQDLIRATVLLLTTAHSDQHVVERLYLDRSAVRLVRRRLKLGKLADLVAVAPSHRKHDDHRTNTNPIIQPWLPPRSPLRPAGECTMPGLGSRQKRRNAAASPEIVLEQLQNA